MFAVPGWSLSAKSLKRQVEDTSAKSGAKKSKKRKRGAANSVVTEENVAELWDAHNNGEDPVVAAKKAAATKVAESGQPDMTGEDEAPKPEQKKRKKNKDKTQGANDSKSTLDNAASAKSKQVEPAGPTLTPLQAAMRQKLISARFRHLNQTLYTAPSTSSLELFSANPDMFNDYHSGFRQQVSVWPENPVQVFIRQLRTRAKVKPPKFNRYNKKPAKAEAGPEPLMRTQGVCTVADLGCGDAQLATDLTGDKTAKKCGLKLLSYDLQSNSPHVTKADIAKLPLADGSVDVAIFCLALMGTNWIDFIEEAYRVLHWKGELWIAEIKSRFGRAGEKPKNVVGHSVGSKKKQLANRKSAETQLARKNEAEDESMLKTEVDGHEKQGIETDVGAFLAVLSKRGFTLKNGDESVDLTNKMFVRLELVKAAKPTVGKNVPPEQPGKQDPGDTDGKGRFNKKPLKFFDAPTISVEQEAAVLKPCLYKIR